MFSGYDGRVANAWCWGDGLQVMEFGEESPVVLTVGSSHYVDDTPAGAPRIKRPDRSSPPSLKRGGGCDDQYGKGDRGDMKRREGRAMDTERVSWPLLICDAGSGRVTTIRVGDSG